MLEDRDLSPGTGWTRAHWEDTADRLLAGVLPYATDGLSQYRMPGPPSRAGRASDGLEGYARTFLLAACRVAGAGGHDPGNLLERYATGLINGTDPSHRYAWPPLTDMSQQLVEAASIAVALHETRPWLFDRLAPAARDRVTDWLGGIVGARTPDSNWVLFRVVVEQFLKDTGGPHRPDEITGGLDRIESWYAGDGWYSDGPGQNFDYYCGWALHLYPVLWARMSGDTARAAVYARRLRLFLGRYRHFFGADGGPIHQGRSLTYRFATVAPFWLGALVDATPLGPGETRRLASAVLRHFTERGAPGPDGLLSPGWYGAFPPMVQPYSGPGSPYWAAKAFLGLLLPADHPVWTAREVTHDGDTLVALPAPGWLLHGAAGDGVVKLVNHGSDRAAKSPGDPFYARLGYSTHTGPALAGDAVDGQITVLAPDGTATRRREITRIGVADRFAASAYTDGGVRVVTASVVSPAAEVRVHAVTAPPGHTVRDGGYALAVAHDDAARRTPGSGAAHECAAGAGATGSGAESLRAVVTRADGLISSVTGLAGFSRAAVRTGVGDTAYGPVSATPYLTGTHPGGTRVYVSVVTLGGSVPDVGLDPVRGTEVTVRWPDGTAATVDVGARPAYARRDPDGAVRARWPVETAE